MHREKHSVAFDATVGRISTPLITKTAPILVKMGITPNHFTLSNLLLGALTLYYLLLKNYFMASIFILSITFIDGIDGTYARLTKQVTELGRKLDRVVDATCFTLTYTALTSTTILGLYALLAYYIDLFSYDLLVNKYNKIGVPMKPKNSVLSYFTGTTSERLVLSGTLILTQLLIHLNFYYAYFPLNLYLSCYNSLNIFRSISRFYRIKYYL